MLLPDGADELAAHLLLAGLPVDQGDIIHLSPGSGESTAKMMSVASTTTSAANRHNGTSPITAMTAATFVCAGSRSASTMRRRTSRSVKMPAIWSPSITSSAPIPLSFISRTAWATLAVLATA